jgi:beta-lactam-binding protein with PASTA domain
VQVSYQVAGCTEDGLVTATAPSVGMPVNPSIGVVLTLCAAPTPEPQPTPIPQPTGPLMPYIIGKHPDEARKQLQDMGVEPSFELVDSNCDRQTVVSSYPNAGEPIDPAVGVSIGVCAPPPDN